MAKCGDFVGCFVTLCEDDGSFMARQCHPSTGENISSTCTTIKEQLLYCVCLFVCLFVCLCIGYCWCLNEMGEKVEGTDTAPFLLKSLDCTSKHQSST